MKRYTVVLLALLALASCHGGSSETGPTGLRGKLTFLGSSPPPGGTIVLDRLEVRWVENVSFRFSVTVDESLPVPAAFKVELLDANGQSCAFTFGYISSLTPGQPLAFDSSFLVLEHEPGAPPVCTLPFTTSVLRATLTGDGSRSPFLEISVPVSYNVTEPAPSASAPTAPRILELDWQSGVEAAYCPLPGDGLSMWCKTIDDNGDAMTVTLRLINLHPGPRTTLRKAAQSYPPSTSAHRIYNNWSLPTPADLRVICRATDAGGLTTSQSIDISCYCGGGWGCPRD